MPFERDKIYWVEHPEHGTMRALMHMVGRDDQALLLKLETPIALRSEGGGLAIMDWLALQKTDGDYTELHTGQVWKIYETEPAKKLPTK